jgi:tetratricopeptide (TPR) repeat protein
MTRRAYHALTTRYNVLFNANESFKEGIDEIDKNHVEDYSRRLPIFVISRHESAEAGKNNMAFAIVKANKAVKAHSIRVKPARGKGSEEFRNRPEFNSVLDNVWLLMGKSHFYSADFLSAQLAFAQAGRQFGWDKAYLAETQLWTARAYIEMGWLYEAEDVFTRLNQSVLPNRLTAMYAEVFADLLIRQNKAQEALSYLQMAAKNESNRKQRARIYFVMAQIYEKLDDRKNAFAAYGNASKGASFEMEFNARILQTEMYTGSKPEEPIKKLRSMTRGSRYSDRLDRIYLAIGNIYLRSGNEEKAIENYKLGIEKSEKKGFELGQVMVALAELYYNNEKFIDAEPLYTEAARIISNEHEKFPDVKKRSEVLSELVPHLKTVQLQDSLQALSLLSEAEQLKIVKEIIKKKKEEDEKARKDSIQETRPAYFNPLLNNTQTSSSFYFYNLNLVENGRNEFNRKWGRRTLEDDWARQAKSSVGFGEEMAMAEEELPTDSLSTDSLQTGGATAAVSMDVYSPEFYLQQIPRTPEQIQASNVLIADALYKGGMVYKDRMENNRLAAQMFEELARRFPYDPRIVDAYFYAFQVMSKDGNEEQAEHFRQKIITEFPESIYAQVLSQPDYQQRMERAAREQETVYRETYTAYLGNDFETVKKNYAKMQVDNPTSDLLPKMSLLNALSVGKSESSENFKTELNALMEAYPNTDVSAMAKDLLALVEQGRMAQIGDAHGSLLDLRAEAAAEELAAASPEAVVRTRYQVEKDARHSFIIIVPKTHPNINRVVYNLSDFNFTNFLLKDYDVEIVPFNATMDFVIVHGLDNQEAAVHYMSEVLNDAAINTDIDTNEMGCFIISEENYTLLEKQKNFAVYQPFFQRYIFAPNADTMPAPIFGVGAEARKVYMPREIVVE